MASRWLNGILKAMQEEPIQVISPQVNVPISVVDTARGRHFLIVFFFSFMWGIFGVDRFYLGKIWTGVLKLLTVGGFGIWVITDLAQIMSGSMRDKQGNAMLEFAKYKKFATKTVLIFTIILAVTTILTGAALFYAIYDIITQYMQGGSGALNNLLPGNIQIPGLDKLQNL